MAMALFLVSLCDYFVFIFEYVLSNPLIIHRTYFIKILRKWDAHLQQINVWANNIKDGHHSYISILNKNHKGP